MELVLNKPEYWESIRTLRNHPDVKGGFIQQEDIERESHEKYMLKYGVFFYICLIKDEPAGDSGIVIVDDDIVIDQDKVNEERRAYLEESRSQEASD